ncbi:MAG: V-type ATP synthase subunit K [Thermoprotei archaeon]|nr:MAG: V-type ATP synthase subunit K [Thermoprotei archaeon]RLF20049.1 MAG: V-type ATP synthase subunit K [Thermoprotei archaeon]
MKKLLIIGLIITTLSLAVAVASVVEAYSQFTAGADEGAVAEGETIMKIGLSRVGSGLAIGLAGLGAGIGLGTASAAAIGVVAEKPEMFGRTMIYVVFTEAIAIYGLVIALLLWLG